MISEFVNKSSRQLPLGFQFLQYYVHRGVSSEGDFLVERYKEVASVNVRPIRPWLRLFLFIFASSDQSARLP